MVVVTIEIPQWRVDMASMPLYAGRADFVALHRGRFPRSRLCWTTAFLQLLRKVMDVPVCRSCRFSSLLCAESASHGPDCCRTKEFPQFVDMVADLPVVWVLQILRCYSREDVGAPTVAAR